MGLAQVRIVSLPFLKCGIAHVEWVELRRWGETSDPQIFAALLTALREEYAIRRKLLLKLCRKSQVMSVWKRRARQSRQVLKGISMLWENRTIIKDISPPLSDIRMSFAEGLAKISRPCRTQIT